MLKRSRKRMILEMFFLMNLILKITFVNTLSPTSSFEYELAYNIFTNLQLMDYHRVWESNNGKITTENTESTAKD